MRFGFLDGLRGLAAIYIVVFHAYLSLYQGLATFSQHPELHYPFASITAYLLLPFYYGRQIVIFFFVISGFVIHYRQAKAIQESADPHFDARTYFFRRARRIYPPLLFALVLTWALDRLGMGLGFTIYTQEVLPGLVINPVHDLPTLLGNLLFLNNAYVLNFGSNGVLWSLMLEWWFYMLYPLLLWLNRRSVWYSLGVVVLLFISSLMGLWSGLVLAQLVFGSLLAWWMGALLAEVVVGRIKVKLWKVGLVSLLLLPLAPTPFITVRLPQTIQDVLWAAAFAGVIAALLAWQRRGGSLRPLERIGVLGDMSYTLYVTHYPIIIFLAGWYVHQFGTRPITTEWVFLGTVLCLLVGWAAHYLVERPFLGRRPISSQPGVHTG
jgi:peptidoglycan/LPS O-acetylase OafA/YrhL